MLKLIAFIKEAILITFTLHRVPGQYVKRQSLITFISHNYCLGMKFWAFFFFFFFLHSQIQTGGVCKCVCSWGAQKEKVLWERKKNLTIGHVKQCPKLYINTNTHSLHIHAQKPSTLLKFTLYIQNIYNNMINKCLILQGTAELKNIWLQNFKSNIRQSLTACGCCEQKPCLNRTHI